MNQIKLETDIQTNHVYRSIKNLYETRNSIITQSGFYLNKKRVLNTSCLTKLDNHGIIRFY